MINKKYTVVLIDGKRYDPWSPEGCAPAPETVAWGLSNLNRYGGHTTRPLSVAEHSIWVALNIACAGHNKKIFKKVVDLVGIRKLEDALNILPCDNSRAALIGLCHDAPEGAGLVDLPSPVGRHVAMQEYKEAHDRCATWLCTDWGITAPPWPTIIKETDNSVLGAEAAIRPDLKLKKEEKLASWPYLDLANQHDLSKLGTEYIREVWVKLFYHLKNSIEPSETFRRYEHA